MLCSFITDLIARKVECGECLCGNKKNKTFDEVVEMLHCFVGEHWQDVGLLDERSYCSQDSVWSASMRDKKIERFDEEVGMSHCFVG